MRLKDASVVAAVYREAAKTMGFWPSPAPKYNRGQKPKRHGGARAEETIGAKAEKKHGWANAEKTIGDHIMNHHMVAAAS